MLPSKKQWKSWSLPSKYTTLSFLVGLVAFFLALIPFFKRDKNNEMLLFVRSEIRQTYEQMNQETSKKQEYVARYLKKPLAELYKHEAISIEAVSFVRIYYSSFWIKLTSSFHASVEVRLINELNKKYNDDEGWAKADLFENGEFIGHEVYLGESEYFTVSNLFYDAVYEVRMVDFNYDSDEPPTRQYRFQVN